MGCHKIHGVRFEFEVFFILRRETNEVDDLCDAAQLVISTVELKNTTRMANSWGFALRAHSLLSLRQVPKTTSAKLPL